MFPILGFAFAAIITLAAQTSATAAVRIRLAVERTGTLARELDVTRRHGVGSLWSEKRLRGDDDATLTCCNVGADLERKDYHRAIAMDDVMKGVGANGPVALVAYPFDRTWAARNGSTVERFLAAARQAK